MSKTAGSVVEIPIFKASRRKVSKKYSVGSFLNTVYHRPGGEWTLERRNCEIFKSTKYSVGMSWNFCY